MAEDGNIIAMDVYGFWWKWMGVRENNQIRRVQYAKKGLSTGLRKGICMAPHPR